MWMLQTDVPVVLLDSGLNGTAGVPKVDLTTFVGHAVHAWVVVCSLFNDAFSVSQTI
jgi:hypothetical protein